MSAMGHITADFVPDEWLTVTPVGDFWNVEHALPFPRTPMACPFCGNCAHLILYWKFGPEQHHRYYCDVGVKCMDCCQVTIFGVEVPKGMVDALGGHSVITIRDYLHNSILPKEGP